MDYFRCDFFMFPSLDCVEIRLEHPRQPKDKDL